MPKQADEKTLKDFMAWHDVHFRKAYNLDCVAPFPQYSSELRCPG